jgi:hypothetical protein
MKKIFIIAILFISLNSCTDAQKAKIGAFGDTFKVELINCDGTITYHWISTGKVSNSESSDGYYFNDSKTGTLIEVSGNVIITRLKVK